MKSQAKQPGPTIKQAIVAMTILFALAAGAIFLIWVIQQQSSDQYQSRTSDAQALNNCLQSAWDKLDEGWSDSIDMHTGHNLTVAYYNDQIDCHSQLNTTNSKEYDIQGLVGRKEDEQLSYQVRSKSHNTQQSNRKTCITNALGSTAYTNCY
ncbi:hypothetical protein GX865_01820 [Candidatus Saccharibacteria bacterium]|jgi:histidyl-tRNA synthetase|nr:hypothetical protein [Candidatus Saccharibacteria bacterium]